MLDSKKHGELSLKLSSMQDDGISETGKRLLGEAPILPYKNKAAVSSRSFKTSQVLLTEFSEFPKEARERNNRTDDLAIPGAAHSNHLQKSQSDSSFCSFNEKDDAHQGRIRNIDEKLPE